MAATTSASNAWDEDWETLADKADEQPASVQPNLSKAQRRRQHQEANMQMWEAAEGETQQFHYLESKTHSVPLKSEFKPTIKVLSRKPATKTNAGGDHADGLQALDLNGEDDSEEEARKAAEASFEERQRKARLEREEKQRRYAEARQRLFGSPSPGPADGKARKSPQRAYDSSGSRNSNRKGRGKGTRENASSSTDQSPARPGKQGKQLFDPSYSAKPNSTYLAQLEAPGLTPKSEELRFNEPIRAPRGPDRTGRGFGINIPRDTRSTG